MQQNLSRRVPRTCARYGVRSTRYRKAVLHLYHARPSLIRGFILTLLTLPLSKSHSVPPFSLHRADARLVHPRELMTALVQLTGCVLCSQILVGWGRWGTGWALMPLRAPKTANVLRGTVKVHACPRRSRRGSVQGRCTTSTLVVFALYT